VSRLVFCLAFRKPKHNEKSKSGPAIFPADCLLMADFVESYRGAVRPFMRDLPPDDIAPQ
jgi:hypothetical protein